MKTKTTPNLRKQRRASVGADISTPPARVDTKHLLAEHSCAAGKREVSVRFYSPQANQVLITGSFNEWNAAGFPLASADDGWWSAELELAPGRYEYRFLVDGDWRNAPEADGYVSNPYGTLNCVLIVK